nr:MAG TPA: hypothetical protein [Bacteriophage sp.]
MFLIIMKFILSLLSLICAFVVSTTLSTVLWSIAALLWFINGILEVRYYRRRKNNVI